MEIPHDLFDPLESAIWSALQLYVDHPYSDAYLAPLGSRRAWELEEYLKDLWEAMHGVGPMDSAELYDAARRMLEIIFASEEAGGYSVPRGAKSPPVGP